MVMQNLLAGLSAKDIIEYCVQSDPNMLSYIISGFMLYNGGDQLKMTVTCKDHDTGKIIGKTEIDIKHYDFTT